MSFIFKFKSNNGVYTLFDGAYSFAIETSKYSIIDCAKLTDADLLTLAQDVFAGYITTLHLVSFYSYLQLRLIAGSSNVQVQDDGVFVAKVAKFNFAGPGVTATLDPSDISGETGLITINNTSITVEDVLTSTNTVNALSAAQGKILKDGLDAKLDANSYNDYYKGTYTTLGNLQTAIPTSTSGTYAIIDTGVGNNAKIYIWDVQAGWIEGSSAGSATTDALPEGSTNLYFTNDRAVSALTASLLSNLTPTVNPQSGTSYTVGTVGTDNDGKTILRMDSAADNTATITTAQTMPISIRQAGLGTTTIGAGAGVTLNGAATFTSQHQTKTVYRVSAGIYDIVG